MRALRGAHTLLLILLGCGSEQRSVSRTAPTAPTATAVPAAVAAPTSRTDPTCKQPGGSRAELSIPPHATSGPQVEEPISCDGGFSHWIRIHASGGARSLDPNFRSMPMRRSKGPCDSASADPVTCPKIALDVFTEAVLAALHERFNGLAAERYTGIGVCGDARAGFGSWNTAATVHDWHDADEAIRIIDAEMKRWGLRDDYGLVVTPLHCVTLD